LECTPIEDIEGSAAKLLHTYQLLQDTFADHNSIAKIFKNCWELALQKGEHISATHSEQHVLILLLTS